jgi:hypothetical protein
MVDMHRRVFLPPRKNPVDETFKCGLLGLAIKSPPIIETQVAGGIPSDGSEQVFQSFFFQRVAFHVEADIQGRRRRQECEATTRIILSGTQDRVSGRDRRVGWSVFTLLAGSNLEIGLLRQALLDFGA